MFSGEGADGSEGKLSVLQCRITASFKAYYSNWDGFRKEIRCILKDISLCGMGLIFLDRVPLFKSCTLEMSFGEYFDLSVIANSNGHLNKIGHYVADCIAEGVVKRVRPVQIGRREGFLIGIEYEVSREWEKALTEAI